MEKPLCRLCGHRHSGMDHIFSKKPKPVPRSKSQFKKLTAQGALNPVRKKAKSKKKFDRNVYQRDYMRKWRKQKK